MKTHWHRLSPGWCREIGRISAFHLRTRRPAIAVGLRCQLNESLRWRPRCYVNRHSVCGGCPVGMPGTGPASVSGCGCRPGSADTHGTRPDRDDSLTRAIVVGHGRGRDFPCRAPQSPRRGEEKRHETIPVGPRPRGLLRGRGLGSHDCPARRKRGNLDFKSHGRALFGRSRAWHFHHHLEPHRAGKKPGQAPPKSFCPCR